MTFKHLILSLFVFLSISLSGQKKFREKHEFQVAKEYLRVEEYDVAAEIFEELLEVSPENSNYKYYLGLCNFKLGNRDRAQDIFEQLKHDSVYSSAELNYYLAKTYHKAHHFEDALKYYKIYLEDLQNADNPKDHPVNIKEVKKEIENCERGEKIYFNPRNMIVENIGHSINSSFPEYTPILNSDETVMYFTSRRPGAVGQRKNILGEYFEDIYMSELVDGEWSAPKNIGPPINTEFHDATVYLSPDGQELYFYRSEFDYFSEKLTGHLYVSKKEGENWGEPIKLPEPINTNHWEASACFNSTGDMIIFSSNRHKDEKDRDDKDLYMCKKDAEGNWGEVIELGDEINTTSEEDGPYLSADDKTLYFSSKGHESIGGFDLYKSEYDENTNSWGPVENMGYPLNSAGHDIYIHWNKSGKKAYFSSTRDDSYGKSDIFFAEELDEKNALAILNGVVYDNETLKPLKAEIIVTNNETDEVEAVYESTEATGKYTIMLPSGINYGIDVKAPDYLLHSENLDLPHSADYTRIKKNIYLHPFVAGESEVLRNIFFDTDEAELKAKSKAELDRLYVTLKKKPNLYVQFSGHTDNRASHEYNVALSEARAAAVVQYLIDKGMDPDKFIAVGFGETQPIADNNTEEGREQNRRVEFKILDGNDEVHQKYLKDIKQAYVTPGSERYAMLLENFKQVYLNDEEKHLPEVGEVLNQKVHFQVGDADYITDYSRGRLNELVNYLNKFSEVKIEIIPHADFYGDQESNLEISRKRGRKVYDYLVQNGIDKERLKFDEQDSLEKIVSADLEKGNTRSRRVEFKVIEI